MTAPVAVRLSAEWQRLAHRRAAVARANGWQLVDVQLDDLDQLLSLSGLVARGASGNASPTVDGGQANALVGRLLERAATDELAGRILLQRLLPGLIISSRRRGPDREANLEALVAAAWTVVRTFNPRRRPTHLAATLVRDCEYEAFRRAGRRKLVSTAVAPSSFDELAGSEGRPDAMAELLDLVADGRRAGLVSDADVLALGATLRGELPDAVAARLKISSRTLRARRAELTRRLRSVARSAAAA